ncbi:MAG: hypothetical protein IKK41_00175 [Oscillospiraceae bacterium]|nr:hypothetical protein [Oscillospiraceae bacterium]
MVDYEFYVNCYLGSGIPEKAFPTAAAQAAAALDRILRIYTVAEHGEQTRKLAICAMAEAVYAASRRKAGVTAASVGNVSVRYENGEHANKSLQRELYQKAAIYLDIYRGAQV